MNKTIRTVTYASAMIAALAAAMPSHAQLTDADRVGTALLIESPTSGSASGGSSAPGAARMLPQLLADGSVPDRIVVISEMQTPRWVNVDYDNAVLFLVRQQGAPDRMVQWRFNGIDNTMSYADIDPHAKFARDLRIYVNQTLNPLQPGGGADSD
jgi:hypothetical protein